MFEEMIVVKQFSKQHGDFAAVDNISFSVNRGEIFGLLGPNGLERQLPWNAWKGCGFLTPEF